jgi:RNase P subunit RPR2
MTDKRSAKQLAEAIRDLCPGDKKGDVSGTTRRIECPGCGRPLIVEEVVVLGWKDEESVNCPHCGIQAYSAMCWSLSIRAEEET